MTNATKLDRWVLVGTSTAKDAATAVQEALAGILEKGEPKLTILFASPAYDLGEMAPLVKAAIGSSELIGCWTVSRAGATAGATAGVAVIVFLIASV